MFSSAVVGRAATSPYLYVSILVCGQHWPVCIYFGVWLALTCVYLFWCVVSTDLCVSILVCGQPWPMCICFGECSHMQAEDLKICVHLFWCVFVSAGWGHDHVCNNFCVCSHVHSEGLGHTPSTSLWQPSSNHSHMWLYHRSLKTLR